MIPVTTTTRTAYNSATNTIEKADLNGMNMLIEAIACIDKSITKDGIVSVLPKDLHLGPKRNAHYNYNSVHGYDLCNLCGKKVARTKDGAVRKHSCTNKRRIQVEENN